MDMPQMTRKPQNRLRRLWRDRRGIAMVEFGLVSGILCTMALGVVDFGVGLWSQMELQNAVDAGAQYVMWYQWNQSGITSAVQNATKMSLGGSSGNTVSVTQACACPDSTGGIIAATCGTSCSQGGATASNYITITANYSYSTIFTWPGISNPMTLSATAVVQN